MARSALCGLLAALLVGGLARADDGPVWVLHGKHNTVYLAGSVHLLKPTDAALPPALLQAYAAAEQLVMELDLDDLDPAAAATFTQQNAIYPDGSGLRQAVGEEIWGRAKAASDRLGVPLEALDRLEPWAVALLLSVTELTQRGLDPSFGVEEQLKQKAQRDHKPITGLETIEFQLGLFDGLSQSEQARFLDLSIRDAETTASAMDALTLAWRAGNSADLQRVLLSEYAAFPELYEALVYRRNRAWLPRVRALLEQRDDVLVVVGAMHLVGERGVVALLRQDGLAPQSLKVH